MSRLKELKDLLEGTGSNKKALPMAIMLDYKEFSPMAIMLDYKEFSDDAFAQFKAIFKKLDVYMGNVEKEYYGKSESDSWLIYLAPSKMTKKQLVDAGFIVSPEED